MHFPGLALALDRFEVEGMEGMDRCLSVVPLPLRLVPLVYLALCDAEESPCGMEGSVRSLRSVMFFSSLSALTLRRFAH